MLNWEEIDKANQEMVGTNIQGKKYAMVNERIKAFRKVCPGGAIITEMLSNEGGVCIIRANVLDEDMRTLGTGHAYENEKNGYINKTSYIENCETSAVGRALGMCGFGIDENLASREEVENAKKIQALKPCEACGRPIAPYKKKNGEIWEAGDIAEYSKTAFGKEMCASCVAKAMKETNAKDNI